MKRAVRSLIQIVAGGFVVFGALEIALELVRHQVHIHNSLGEPSQSHIWPYILGVILIILGVILFLGSNSLAEQLTDDTDDDE